MHTDFWCAAAYFYASLNRCYLSVQTSQTAGINTERGYGEAVYANRPLCAGKYSSNPTIYIYNNIDILLLLTDIYATFSQKQTFKH